MDNRAAQVRKKETIQNTVSKIASPAVMRKMGITEGDVSTGNLQTMYNLARMAKNYCSDPEGKEALTELLRILKWYMDQGNEQGVEEGWFNNKSSTNNSSYSSPYQVLGFDPTKRPPSSDAIKQAYRVLASKNHPDKGGDPATFQKISAAYKALVSSGAVIRETKGMREGKIDFAKKLQKNVDKHNKAVVQTKKDIGSRVADIGPGGKEYNVKTDAAWDAAKKKVSEGYKKK
jgi:hypothetical protein